jgi:hypothetical protein
MIECRKISFSRPSMPTLCLTAPLLPKRLIDSLEGSLALAEWSSLVKEPKVLKKRLKTFNVKVSTAFWVAFSETVWMQLAKAPETGLSKSLALLCFLAQKTGWKTSYTHWVMSVVQHKQDHSYSVGDRNAYLEALDNLFDYVMGYSKGYPLGWCHNHGERVRQAFQTQHTLLTPWFLPWVQPATRRWIGLTNLEHATEKVFLASRSDGENRRTNRFLRLDKDLEAGSEQEWAALRALTSSWEQWKQHTTHMSSTERLTLLLKKLLLAHRTDVCVFSDVNPATTDLSLNYWNFNPFMVLDEYGFYTSRTPNNPIPVTNVDSQAALAVLAKLNQRSQAPQVPSPSNQKTPPVFVVDVGFSIYHGFTTAPKTLTGKCPRLQLATDEYLNDGPMPSGRWANQTSHERCQRVYGPLKSRGWTRKAPRVKASLAPPTEVYPTSESVDIEALLAGYSTEDMVTCLLNREFSHKDSRMKQVLERMLLKIKTNVNQLCTTNAVWEGAL